MKRTFIFILFCTQCINLWAQDRKSLTVIHIVENNVANKTVIPYSGIEILDARFDQSKIGCVYGKNSVFGYSVAKTDAVFPATLKEYLPQVLNNIVELDSSAKEKVLILVKRFRIAEYMHYDIYGVMQPQLTMSISASFYAASGDILTRLFSIDDLLSTNVLTGKEPKAKHRDDLKETSYETRSKAIITMLDKAIGRKIWTAPGKSFVTTKPELEKAVMQRFDLPIYHQQLQQGIYLSFKEFKENKPSVTNIQIVYKKDRIDKVFNDKHVAVPLNEIWGLSDGQKAFMVFRNNLNELVRCDRSFRILSYRTKADTRGRTNYGELAGQGDFIGGGLAKLSDNARNDEYFDLNMENGELFLEELTGTSTMRKEVFK